MFGHCHDRRHILHKLGKSLLNRPKYRSHQEIERSLELIATIINRLKIRIAEY